MTDNNFFTFPENRDVLFIFGAGASYPAGVPLQRDLLPLIVSGKIPEIESSEIGREVKNFICQNFFIKDHSTYPKLEAIFGYIDYFLFQKESLSAYYNNSIIYNIREYLIRLIHFVVNIKTKGSNDFYPIFWDKIKNLNTNISIITLNYDTLLEQAFANLFRSNFYIDFCMDLLNYQNIEELKKDHFWYNPKHPLPVKDNVSPQVIKIIKTHGSLNWKYCNCCNQVLLTPWDSEIDLTKNKFLGYSYPEKQQYEFVCPFDNNDFETLIMPPTFVKNLKHPVISMLRNEAAKEIRAAKKIVIIGYSLSYSDIDFRALLKKNIKKGTKLYIVNPKISEKFKLKFLPFSDDIEFIPNTFEQFLNDSDCIKKILC